MEVAREEEKQHHHHHHQPSSNLLLGFRSPSPPPTMIASSSMIKESTTSYGMADFDQSAIFLYLDDGHDQRVIQEQLQTLNIFPSRPMHVAESIPATRSVGAAAACTAMLPNAPSLPNSAKGNKISNILIKKEGSSNEKGATSSKEPGERDLGRRAHDPKTLRRLAQNREAARKSRLRKKAYIQQLETSRIRLSQIEHQVQAARIQGVLLGTGEQHQSLPSAPSVAGMFDMEYARWVEEHGKLIFQLRAALNEAEMPDSQLQALVSGAMAQHDELLSLKAAVSRADIFYLLCGVWASPAERCFLWLGGFRPTDVIKVMLKHVEPLSESQLLGIYSFQQSVQETEDALSSCMESLQHSLSDAVAGREVAAGSFMGHMSLALTKIASMEGVVSQADCLRQHTLHKLQHMLTTRQAARCLVSIADYFHRLRAISTLWAARPRHDQAPPPV